MSETSEVMRLRERIRKLEAAVNEAMEIAEDDSLDPPTTISQMYDTLDEAMLEDAALATGSIL